MWRPGNADASKWCRYAMNSTGYNYRSGNGAKKERLEKDVGE